MRTKPTGRFIIGFDGSDHVAYENGDVVYERDRLVFVGHGYPGPVDETIEVGDAIVSPGFIDLDALADIDHGILDIWQPRGLAIGLQWSEEYFRSRRHDPPRGPKSSISSVRACRFRTAFIFREVVGSTTTVRTSFAFSPTPERP